jgi:hypothetical protein
VPQINSLLRKSQTDRQALKARSRLSRPNRNGARALEELACGDGPPLTTSELARMIGMSATFIRVEIDGGYLTAARVGHGRRPVFRILVREARRYVKKLGLL